ncbi:MAG TPA: hypothetical protein PLI95_26735, partial [Polyangiaceae bacterium]|nr:hypothetical protein [Polyangiaceae bacterium]
ILYGRVSWIDMQKYNVYQGLPTGEVGDCSIQTKLEHTPIVEAVQRTDRSRDPVPFPTGPSAPIWDRNTIAFEDNEGVRIVSVDPPRLLRTVPGTLPLLSTRSRAFVVQDPAGLGPRWVSFEATEVVR